MADCLFCSIAAGGIPSDVVLETDDVVAFNDINPAAPTHVLVIPKRHVASAAELGPEDAGLLSALFEAAARVGRDLEGGEVPRNPQPLDSKSAEPGEQQQPEEDIGPAGRQQTINGRRRAAAP